MSAGRMFVRECGAGHELVCITPLLRHPNRLAERERQHAKLVRSAQRWMAASTKHTVLQCNPWSLPAQVRAMGERRAKRARIYYLREERAYKSGGAR